jgi:NAD(P)-dependent dehydrogenase (short-subunit alcohol dehydrogenase family)
MGLFKKAVVPSQKAYAVVTGAGSGIGRSFALELGKRGGTVVCADINLAAAEETVALLAGLGAKGFAVTCDVGNADAVKELADTAEQLLQHPVTLVINNAGVGLGGKFDEVSLEDWKWVTHVNLWGVIHGCHYFVPKFKKLGYGAIINVASAAGYTAAPEMTAYNVTKSGVLALSETLSSELKKVQDQSQCAVPDLGTHQHHQKRSYPQPLLQACRSCLDELCHDHQRCSRQTDPQSFGSRQALHHPTARRQTVLADEACVPHLVHQVLGLVVHPV